MAVDDSFSMCAHGNTTLAFESLALIANAMSNLEVGQLMIAR